MEKRQTTEEKRKDTSAPGREEEVIINTPKEEQLTPADGYLPTSLPDLKDREKAERGFREGLANNSDTDEKSNT